MSPTVDLDDDDSDAAVTSTALDDVQAPDELQVVGVRASSKHVLAGIREGAEKRARVARAIRHAGGIELDAGGGPVDLEGGGAAVAVDSDAESSVSSSSSSSSSRRRCVGAAAAAALLTATTPLDLDEAERRITRELRLPSDCAVGLQHAGDLIRVMVDTGAEIVVSPLEGSEETLLLLHGTAHAIGRVVADLELLQRNYQERCAMRAQEEKRRAEEEDRRARCSHLVEVEIPRELVNRVMGANAASIKQVRESCGGIMVALQPSTDPSRPTIALAGPGEKHQVALAERLLLELVDKARSSSGCIAERGASSVDADCGGVLAASITELAKDLDVGD